VHFFAAKTNETDDYLAGGRISLRWEVVIVSRNAAHSYAILIAGKSRTGGETETVACAPVQKLAEIFIPYQNKRSPMRTAALGVCGWM
jgi:hypothetical protein